MKLMDLGDAVRQHAGEFVCERIHDGAQQKIVRFTHVTTPPVGTGDVPAVGRLRDVYDSFGSILLYYDEKSGDAGKFIAPRAEWAELHACFNDWIESLDEDERGELLPDWLEGCVVIGETPNSGNYILVPTTGAESGRVFEFDHDGFEFTRKGEDLVGYIEKLLKPDGAVLTDIASHMRFVDDDPTAQWWIRELRDNRGHVVTTR